MEKWIYYTLISTIFFVIGQVCLKFDDNDAILISCYFNISMGLLGLLTLLYLNNYNLKKRSIAYYGIIAGIFFFLGNIYWINSIKSSPDLSLIRGIMAGSETLLLLIIGYLIFKQQISINNILGFFLIFSGIFLISKNN